ncbi:MAG: PRC-barrel domain-containing protein [Anaerolineae bacterium]
MDIPIGADVDCVDGSCGRSMYAIVDPVAQRVTHLVVQTGGFVPVQRVVSVDLVSESTPNEIRLRCSRDELDGMEEFAETRFVPGSLPELTYNPTQYWMWPATVAQPPPVEEVSNTPPGDIAVRRGARVEATDGSVGRIDEFLVDPASGEITHIVLHEGILWGQKDITIPMSQVARIEEDIVHLKLSKEEVAQLPATAGRH